MNASDGTRRVLHVDDDPDILRYISHSLASKYEVLSVQDPTQCISELVRTGCRVVILDIDMGQHNGLEMLRKIKSFDGGIHVVMLTGLVSMETVLTAMRDGAEACLFKPVKSQAELVQVLNACFKKIDRWYDSLRDLQQRRKNGIQSRALVGAN